MEDSTRSEMVKVVPSTSFTMAVSDLGPESSTERMDLAESFRMVSNSEEVTDGMAGAALAAGVVVGRIRRVEAVVVTRLDRRVRRCIVCWLLEEDCSSS